MSLILYVLLFLSGRAHYQVNSSIRLEAVIFVFPLPGNGLVSVSQPEKQFRKGTGEREI
jgi:hypothetical protein